MILKKQKILLQYNFLLDKNFLRFTHDLVSNQKVGLNQPVLDAKIHHSKKQEYHLCRVWYRTPVFSHRLDYLKRKQPKDRNIRHLLGKTRNIHYALRIHSFLLCL